MLITAISLTLYYHEIVLVVIKSLRCHERHKTTVMPVHHTVLCLYFLPVRVRLDFPKFHVYGYLMPQYKWYLKCK